LYIFSPLHDHLLKMPRLTAVCFLLDARPLLEPTLLRFILLTSPGSSSQRSQTVILSKPYTPEPSPMPSREVRTRPSRSGSASSALSYVVLIFWAFPIACVLTRRDISLQQANVKIESIVLQQLAKAVRSVPGSGEIWAAYIRSLVRFRRCSVSLNRN
jgi:hypothetical protein